MQLDTSSVSSDIVVLGYGCIYQSGFLFSVDDTYADYPEGVSIGGKVATLTNQSSSIIWSSNGTGSQTPLQVSLDIIPGIDELSTASSGSPNYADFASWFARQYPTLTVLPPTAFNACNGATDGACNTANIVAFYNQYQTSIPASNPPTATPLNDYAAGLCKQNIDGYSDWYLPAICEMGPDSGFGICNTTTVEQNIADNLRFMIGTSPPRGRCTVQPSSRCISGIYWSSTEVSCGPQVQVWGQELFQNGGIFQLYDTKFIDGILVVRCVRALSN